MTLKQACIFYFTNSARKGVNLPLIVGDIKSHFPTFDVFISRTLCPSSEPLLHKEVSFSVALIPNGTRRRMIYCTILQCQGFGIFFISSKSQNKEFMQLFNLLPVQIAVKFSIQRSGE